MNEVGGDRPTALYRLFGVFGELLYTGVAYDPEVRIPQHSKKSWYSSVNNRHIEWFPSRPAAEAAEIIAIKIERPLYNVQHHPVNRPARPAKLHWRMLTRWERLGLYSYWLAEHLAVDYATVRTWESEESQVPDWARRELEQLEERTADAVRSYVTQFAGQDRPVMATYRYDHGYRAAHPDANLSASWHRALAFRVRQEVPFLRIRSADVSHVRLPGRRSLRATNWVDLTLPPWLSS